MVSVLTTQPKIVYCMARAASMMAPVGGGVHCLQLPKHLVKGVQKNARDMGTMIGVALDHAN
jgi:hypothetical protein